MTPIEFPQQTDVLAKDQPEYVPLPVYVKREPVDWVDDEGMGQTTLVPMEMTFCCALSTEEIAEANATGKLWFTQCVFGKPFQPVRLSTRNPFEEAPQQPPSPISALVTALNSDPDYRETWKANIAMAFYDAFGSHEFERNPNGSFKELMSDVHKAANKAADNFLNTLCAK